MQQKPTWVRWRRFTLASLLLAITLAAIPFAYVRWVIQSQYETIQLTQTLEREKIEIWREVQAPFWWMGKPDFFSVPTHVEFHTQPTEEELAALRKLPTVTRISLYVDRLSSSTKETMAQLTQLESVHICCFDATDRDLQFLSALPKLRDVGVEGNFTGAFVADLHQTSSIHRLMLAGPKVTDESTKLVAKHLPKLGTLNMFNCEVTEKSLPIICEQLPELFEFHAGGTYIEDEMTKLYRKIRPELMIFTY